MSGPTKRVAREPTAEMLDATIGYLGLCSGELRDLWRIMYDAAPDADAGRVADCQCGKFPVHLTAERFQQAIETEEKLAELERRIERASDKIRKGIPSMVGLGITGWLDHLRAILRGEHP